MLIHCHSAHYSLPPSLIPIVIALRPCTMASESKKPNILSRVFSRFSKRKSKPALAHARNQLEGSSAVAAGPSSSSHTPTHSVPDLSLPAGSSIPQCHESQPPIRQSRSENEMVSSSQSMALSTPSNQDPLRPPQPFPALQSYDNQSASGTHGGTTSLFHGASRFQTGDFHVYVGDKSTDGTSIH